jgi:hypothetical protein
LDKELKNRIPSSELGKSVAAIKKKYPNEMEEIKSKLGENIRIYILLKLMIVF